LSLPTQILVAWGIVAVMMVLLWWRQQITKDATPVDVGWSVGLGLLALFFWAVSPDPTQPRTILVGLLGAVWAFRLGGYLYWTRVRGHREEDGRYQTLRRNWGRRAGVFFFVFYQVQALLSFLFALPFLAAMRTRSEFTAIDFAGIAVWIIAVSGEALADAQLSRFRARSESRGKTCRDGLWSWSRHPNYFFEWLHWWAYVLLSWGAVWWWGTLFAPALMLFFLFKVTGIPATEAQAVLSRGDDYREYQRTTSVFVPWPPKKP
jgi:steroid 5-alpha reductase family enzyme